MHEEITQIPKRDTARNLRKKKELLPFPLLDP